MATDRYRKLTTKGRVILVAVVIVIGLVLLSLSPVFSHSGGGTSGESGNTGNSGQSVTPTPIQTNSQSYQDGYTWGSTTGLGVAYLCNPDSVYGDDDPYNFLAGCTAAADGLRNGTIPNGY